MQKIFSNLINKIFELSLAIILVSAGIYVYSGSYVNGYSIFALFLILVFFMFYGFVHKRKRTGFLFYLLLLIVMYNVLNFILDMQAGSRWSRAANFMEWFFSAGEAADEPNSYLLFFTVGFSFFISSVIYYFTAAIYRPLLVLLISLIPCMIFVKTVTAFPLNYLLLIAALNLFIYIKNCRLDIEKTSVIIDKKAAFICYADFAVAAVILAFIIPKPSHTPYYEQFDEFTSRFTIGRTYVGQEGRFSANSGNSRDFLQGALETLYIVNTGYNYIGREYFKSQVYHNYDEVNNWWTPRNDTVSGYIDWETPQEQLNMSRLLSAYKTAAELSPNAPYDIADLIANITEEDTAASVFIRTVDFPAQYFIAPSRAFNVLSLNPNVTAIYRSNDGEFFPNTDFLGHYEVYTVSFYPINYINTSGWLEMGGCDFSFDEFENMLLDMDNILRANSASSDDVNTVNAFIDELNNAKVSLARNYNDVPESIKNLALELTQGYEYDWQKAQAIQNFFHKGDFTYDLAYATARGNNSAEEFIFDTKRGICTDFATAFCLIARGAGLTVRYVEGFVAVVAEDHNYYEITTETAHAYPEVYIPGAGWIIYEPTVAGFLNQNRGGAGANSDINMTIITAIATAISGIIVILLIIIALLLRPILSETFFRIRIKFLGNGECILKLHARYSQRIAKIFTIDVKPLTAEQIFEYSQNLTDNSSKDLLDPFTKVCYGQEDISGMERENALTYYKSQYKALKRRRRDRRKG